MSLSNQIRTARHAAGFTQEVAAKKAGLRQGHWSEVERGAKKNPQWKTVKKIAEALGVSLDYLAGKGK